jgi:hypothetical protein
LAGSNNVYSPSTALLGADRGQQRSLIVAPNFPAAIALHAEPVHSNRYAVSLRVHELATGSETQSIVLHHAEGDYSSSGGQPAGRPIDIAGDLLAICSDGRLYVVPTAKINKDHLTPPFRFKLLQNPLAIGGRGQATLKYELLDGEPPYEVKFTLEGIETRTSARGIASITLDAQDLTARILSTIHQRQWPQNEPVQAGAPPKEPRVRVVDYVDAITPAFKAMVGREPRGVPVFLNATVEATDRKLETARLVHGYLLEIPAATVVKTLTDAANGRITPYEPRPSRVVEQNDQQREQRLAQLDQQLATSYSDELRERHPHAKLDDDQLKRRAERSRDAADAVLARAMAEMSAHRAQEMRTWKDKRGHSTRATLKSAFADQVVLRLASGNEVTVPLNKFSEDDVNFINSAARPEALTPAQRMTLQMRLVLTAIQKHAGRAGGYPPAYIVDSNGSPLLSWRVAILPDLGAQDLFRLFHFDESWDSEHNRKLLPYMPAVFAAAGEQASPEKTSIQALRAPDGVFASAQSLGRRDVAARHELPLLIAETTADFLVPWTEPRDLESERFTALDDVLNPREGRYLVGNSGGLVLTAPVGTPEAAWRKAVSRDDRTLSQIDFEDPMTLPVQAP